MASESSEDGVVSVTLPAELRDWLDEKAAELDVDEETVVAQLLASYRATEELDGSGEHAELLGAEVETAVRDVVAERIPDIARAVEGHLDGGGEQLAAVEDHLEGEIDHLESEVDRLDGEIADVEASFQSKLDDVRERVIQVKKEADSKAPADHSHPELDDVATLRAQLEELNAAVDRLDSAVESQDERLETVESDLEDVGDLDSRLSDAEEKLNTVAWVVSDLREAVEAQRGADRAIEQLKRRAAEEDVERAICDNCESPVDIALLTEPNCPHCEATVNDVRLPGGFFGKPRLSVARQLEAGDDVEDGRSDVPDAARR